MADTRKMSDLMAKYRAGKVQSQVKYVNDWKSQIPSGSRWSPGFPGDPACPSCKGIGFVRVDLPVGHPDMGKLFECECVAQMAARLGKAQAGR